MVRFSNSVLVWVKTTKSLNSYIACRVGEILETSNSEQWRWVSTLENPADLATRYKENHSCSEQLTGIWQNGPSFLK